MGATIGTFSLNIMDNSSSDTDEKVIYQDSERNYLITDSRLQFRSVTVFLRDVTGTDIKISPAFPIMNLLMRISLVVSFVLFILGFLSLRTAPYPPGFFSCIEQGCILAALPFGFYLFALSGGGGKHIKGQLRVTTSKGSMVLAESRGEVCFGNLFHLLFNTQVAEKYHTQNYQTIMSDLCPIQEAISKAMAIAKG